MMKSSRRSSPPSLGETAGGGLSLFDSARSTPQLDFAGKYTTDHALQYYQKHETGWARQLSHWREEAMLREALRLSGEPRSVLDIPCGTGRFWALLTELPDRKIYVADLNQPMIDTALQMRPAGLLDRIEAFRASAFEIPKPDGFVEAAFCIRLFHHLHEARDRLLLLKELARVASRWVILSLWIDGNYKSWRRQTRDQALNDADRNRFRNRFVHPRRVIEAEFAEAGFEIAGRVDFLRFYSMWATYVLRKR